MRLTGITMEELIKGALTGTQIMLKLQPLYFVHQRRLFVTDAWQCDVCCGSLLQVLIDVMSLDPIASQKVIAINGR